MKSLTNYFILSNEAVKQNCLRALTAMPADGKYEVRISRKDKKRTNQQNRLYWGPWLETFSNWMGDSDKDDIHKQFKVRFLGVDRSMVNGVLLIEPKSSATLTTEQFTEFLSKVEMLAREMGISLPTEEYHGLAASQEYGKSLCAKSSVSPAGNSLSEQ